MVRWSALFLEAAPLLSFFAAATALTANDYYVPSELVPGLSSGDSSLIPEMYAGHIPLTNNEDGIQYFFWKFEEKRNGNEDKPLVIWLNGGPGCSSMDGALAENGPIRIDDDGKATINEGSWFTRADTVYVDQPVNTGFSFATNPGPKKYDDDLDVITEHFMQFLDSYFQSFPEDIYKKLILAGESYAGQYIPFFADAILKRNAQLEDEYSKYNLKALLIGNGWIDPNIQSLSYLPFAKEKNLIDESSPYFSNLLRAHENCQNVINSHDPDVPQKFSHSDCDAIIGLLLAYTKDTSPETPQGEVCLNVYDYTLRDSYPSCGMNWPKDVQTIPKFFSTPGVLEALNVQPEDVPRWRECDEGVLKSLTNPRSTPSIHLLPSILESGTDIILFNGDHDLICNTKGTLDTIANLSWGDQKGFTEEAEYYDWVFNDVLNDSYEPAGYVVYENNMTFISVYNASHMVSNDKSMISRGILDIYLDAVALEVIDDKKVLISTNELRPFGDEDNDGGQDGEDYDDYDDYGDNYEEDDKDEKNGQDSDENDEEDDNEYDEEDGNEGEENDEETNKDKDSRKAHKRYKNILVATMTVALMCAIAYYLYRKRFRSGVRAILMSSSRRHDQNKTVSWADDLEGGVEFDVDQELSRPSTAGSKPKSKGSYTSVPSTDLEESFELDDL